MGRVSVVVLGDIGRSPRMQYHSISLAGGGYEVDLVGYAGSKPHRLVVENQKITLRHLSEPPAANGVLGLAFKCLWQTVTLFWCLMVTLARPDAILLQNPPGLPALIVCWMAARLRGARFLVDWHNYTWSILALKWGPKWGKVHPLVRLVRSYEYTVGSWADDGFCVSYAMRKYSLAAVSPSILLRIFYDRPLKDVFRPISLEERHDIMKRMAAISPDVFGADNPGSTRFTEQSANGIRLRQERPALLISSTSWTADEDFGMLFEALTLYDDVLQKGTASGSPNIVCVITGKGPLKEHYLSQVPKWNHVQLCTPWLTAEDYPLLLASADLGVCLHASSSGFDLPMKAVDMLGCRVPVLALKYCCIEELITENRNGRLFNNSESLAGSLVELLTGFNGESESKLEALKRRLNEDRDKNGEGWDWETNWKAVVEPVVTCS